MKVRVFSSIVALLIIIPLLLIGGLPFSIGTYIISLLALYEFIKVKNEKKEIPDLIKFISYIILTLIILFNVKSNELVYSVDYKILAGLFIIYLIPTVLYHDRKKYSINDAFYLIGGILFLGMSLSLIIIVRNINLKLFIYLLAITISTDTYAYFGGRLIGKNRLLEDISPKKTIEGMIVGTIFGVFISTVYYIVVINPSVSIFRILLVSTFLSVLGQLGDLVFSAIKRYYNKKDFSNIMPGHGGILDRLDSIIFVLLGFMFFINII